MKWIDDVFSIDGALQRLERFSDRVDVVARGPRPRQVLLRVDLLYHAVRDVLVRAEGLEPGQVDVVADHVREQQPVTVREESQLVRVCGGTNGRDVRRGQPGERVQIEAH